MALSPRLGASIEPVDRVHRIDSAPADDAPAVRAVDEILDAALEARASDVHLEPADGGGRIRERVDGLLRVGRSLHDPLFSRVVSRIKLLAGMDIADRRLPQDGRFALQRRGRSIEARVSSMPAIGGESLALRFLNVRPGVPDLADLGMPPALLAHYRRLLDAPAGFAIVCGPTGSGKTTTLYASLQHRNVESQHLCTIEDPVELRLSGVTQIQVNVRAGLTFARALRSVLRQDPNVVMLGEMRDAETAETAVAAGLSGQLVLTSLHSADAARAVERLAELGVAPRSAGAALLAIVSQRLVRRLCAHCKTPARDDAGEYAPVGCSQCDGGYRGRIPLFEIVTISESLRELIVAGATPAQLRAAATRAGAGSLAESAAAVVREGASSSEEVRRVLGPSVAA